MTAIRERFLVYHPNARAFRSRRGGELLRSLREHLGESTTLLAGGAPDFETRLAGVDAERDLVAVAGGDGTLYHAVNRLAAARGLDAPWPRVALVPAGTGNDAARAIATLVGRDLHDLASLAAAVERGAAGVPGDLGRLVDGDNQHLFVNFAGFGAPVEWVRLADSRWTSFVKRFAPKLCYSACSLAVLLRRRTVAARVTAEGQTWEGPAFSVVVANAPYLGGGMNLGERARMDSGTLALLRLPKAARRELVALLRAVRAGRGPQLPTLEQLEIELQGGAVANLDGELVELTGGARVHLDVLRQKVRWV